MNAMAAAGLGVRRGRRRIAGVVSYLENRIDNDWRADGQALDAIDQPDVTDGRTENLNKQIGGAIGDGGMFGKLLRGHDQDGQFNELFQAIDIPRCS